jgi:hypothetical protein
VKEVFFFCVALVYQNQPHSSTHAGFVDDIMAASFAARQSNAILARSGETGRAIEKVSIRRQWAGRSLA